MGLFSRRKREEPQEPLVSDRSDQPVGSADAAPTAQTASKVSAPSHTLEKGSGLYAVAQMMRKKGSGELTLDLKQNGNDMNLTLHENGQELEETVVVPGNEWFAGIAQLYVDEEKGARGPFNRALIVLDGSEDSNVQASFLNTEMGTSHNLQYTVPAGVVSPFDEQDETEPAQDYSRFAVADKEEEKSAFSAQDRLSRVSQRITTEEEPPAAQESFKAVAFGTEKNDVENGERTSTAHSSDASTGTTEDVADEDIPFVSDSEPEENAGALNSLSPVEEEAISEELEETRFVQSRDVIDELEDHSSQNARIESTELDTHSASHAEKDIRESEQTRNDQRSSSEAPAVTSAHDISLATATMPDYVDDEWEEETASEQTNQAPRAHQDKNTAGADEKTVATSAAGRFTVMQPHTPAASSSSQTVAAEVPEAASGVDVAPSFSATGGTFSKPSTTNFAEGNLVLTEAEVVNRLAGVQKALFGENGSARDVSTVLIRIRTLGSYYDALTHVRQGGFWDQKRTFDLIPEDELNVLQLKADSYKEGFGSPLAMSIRLTPGIPPQVKFDYQNEGAFAKYSDELPAQQYVEELRMFPRTGANIPDHMNRALASWTL